MDPMPPGTWRLEASADGHQTVAQDVTVVAGETFDVEIVLPRNGK